jgi:hypothetical protein
MMVFIKIQYLRNMGMFSRLGNQYARRMGMSSRLENKVDKILEAIVE